MRAFLFLLCLITSLSYAEHESKERPVDDRSDAEEEFVPNPLKVKLTKEERDMFREVNQWRAANRIKTKLKPAASLMRGCCEHSKRMSDFNVFRHADHEVWRSYLGFQPVLAGNRAGVRSENIAAGHDSVAKTLQQWKTSTGHNANMLSVAVQYMGICRSTRKGTEYTHYWTQCFSAGPEE